MTDAYKTKAQLIKEIAELRSRVSESSKTEIERVRSERDLRRSKENLQAFLNATTELAMLIDTRGRILELNAPFANRFGKEIDSLVGTRVIDLMEPEFAELRKRQFAEVTKTGKPLRFEDERAGRILDHNLYPVFNPDGKVEGIAIFARDVTHRRRGEEALRYSEEMMKKILSASPVAISYVEEGRLIWTNQAMVQMFQYEEGQEYVGKRAKEFYASEEEYKRVLEIFRKCLKERSEVATEAEFRRQDGSIFFGQLKISALDASNLGKGTISAIADVTAQKEAEDRLRQSREEFRRLDQESKRGEDLYRSLLNASADAVIVYDLEGNAQYVNDSFTRIFGWSLDELRGHRVPYVPESERDESMTNIGRLIGEGVPVPRF